MNSTECSEIKQCFDQNSEGKYICSYLCGHSTKKESAMSTHILNKHGIVTGVKTAIKRKLKIVSAVALTCIETSVVVTTEPVVVTTEPEPVVVTTEPVAKAVTIRKKKVIISKEEAAELKMEKEESKKYLKMFNDMQKKKAVDEKKAVLAQTKANLALEKATKKAERELKAKAKQDEKDFRFMQRQIRAEDKTMKLVYGVEMTM